MAGTLQINNANLDRLQQLAQQAGSSVDAVLERLLDQTTPAQFNPYFYLNAAPSAIVVVDISQPNQPAVYVNHAFERETGYACSEIIGQNLNILQRDDRDQPAVQAMREAVKNRQSCTVVLRNYRKDGTLFWNEMRLAPLADEQGKITRYLSIQNDVTARVQAQEALLRSEELYRLLTDNLREAITLHTPDGRITFASPVNELVSGYTATEMMGMTIADLAEAVHPDDLQKIRENFHAKLRLGVPVERFEYRMRHKDGRYIWVEHTAVPFLNAQGEVEQFLSTTRDISERKEAERRLLNNQYFITRLMQALPNFIYVYDFVENRNVFANAGLTKLLGYTPEELQAMGSNALPTLVHPDDQNACMEGIRRVRTAQDDSYYYTTTYRLKHKDGSLRWIQDQGVIFKRADDGTVEQILGSVTDITDRIEAQNALETSKARYKLLTELISDYAMTTRVEADGALVFEWIAGGFENITGYDPETALGWPPAELRHPDDMERVNAEVARTMQGETTTSEYRIRHKDGDYRWIRVLRKPIWDDVQQRVVRFHSAVTDITERKRIEEELRRSEEMYRLIAENTSDGIVVWDEAKGQITYASSAYNRHWRREADSTTGFTLTDIRSYMHPDDVDGIFQRIYQAIDHHEDSLTYIYRGRYTEAQYAWKEDHTRFVYDDDGNFIRAYIISRDITARKTVEDALLHSQAMMRDVLSSVQDIVYALTLPELDVLYMSDAAETITGYPVAEFFERKELWSEFIHPDDLIQVQGGEGRVIEQGHADWVYRVIRRDGEIRRVHNRAWLVRDDEGRPSRLTGIITDITEHRRTQALVELQKAALESAANAIVITDDDLRIEWVNPAFTRMTGYTIEEAHNKNLHDLVKSGQHDEAFYADIWNTITSGNVWQGQLINRRQDGTVYTEEQTITPVYNNEREISHFVAIKQDVTERERHQQFILEYEGLKARFQKEQQQHMLIQQTIAALSHDIRTPLNVIATTKDILSRHFHKLSDDRRQEKLDSIGRQLQYAVELLDDTVNVVKSNLNHRVFRPAPVHLAALCRVSVEEVNNVHEKTHSLHFVNLAGIDTVSVDEILVSRILVNLLSNAIKYSPDGGEIRLELDRREDWLLLRVVDHGIGIHPDDLPHIFDPFYRSPHVEGIGGTGLGLSIVKDCVDRHQGQVKVESIAGQGSAFTVELPLM